MHAALCNFLSDYLGASSLGSSAPEPACAASDVMAMISALTDVAGRRGTMHPAKLSDGIEGAVLGYLGLKR